MDLRITQIHGRIGIDQYPSQLHIKQPKPMADIRQRQADITIRTTQPKVHVDQTQCYIESGLKPILMLNKDYYSESLRAGIEAIGNIAMEANALMDIEKGGNPIAEIALTKLESKGELNIVMMPRSRPKIWTDLGKVDIDISPNPADIKWNIHTRASIEATRHKVDIYMDVWPDINIDYIGKTFDREV
ncbi:MAG: hypothetical protein GX974_08355 [Clostridiales bacterium]|nr:hypothetical protein [Clostridiales bacterium]